MYVWIAMTSTLSPAEIVASLRDIGIKKAALPFSSMIIMGILAGVYIGFGAHLATTVATGTSEFFGYGITKLITGSVFSVGLVLVILGGAELFTGNTLISVAFLDKKVKLVGLLKNWLVVYGANLIGSLLLAFLIYFAGSNGMNGHLTPVGETAVKIASAKAILPLEQVFFRAILANWLVCLAIFLSLASKDVIGKIIGCFFPIMAFVAMGFEHSIANMYFFASGMLAAQGSISVLTLSTAAANIAVATVGNIIGGAFFVGGLYWFVFLRKK